MPDTNAKSTLKDRFADALKPVMVQAIDKGVNAKGVQRLLARGVSPHTPDTKGRLPVDAALERRAYTIVRQLMAAGAAPPAYDGDPNGPPVYTGDNETFREKISRHTALTYFIGGNDYSIIFTLLCNGADVNLENADGVSPLQAALTRQWPYVATQLVKAGAWRTPEQPDINEVVDTATGTTRLMAVILEGQDGLAVKKILEDGADPNKPDDNGITPIALARALRWDYVADLLIQHGAKESPLPDPNQMCGEQKDKPLLCYAASYQGCHSNYIHALLEAGADPDAQDGNGKTALHWAAVFNKPWLFDLLLEAGADMNVIDEYGLKPLHYACMNNSKDIALDILDATNNADINTPVGDYHRTPLMMAAGRPGAYALVQALVARGAYINQPDVQAETPLGKAISARDIHMTKLLVQEGADVAKDSPFPVPEAPAEKPGIYRRNPPIFALVNSQHENNLALAQVLLDAGANPNAKALESFSGPQAGDSLLCFAIRYRAFDLAEKLLKAGADPHGTSHKGETAMHYCLHLRQVEGVNLLLRHGFDPLRHFEYTQTWSNGTEDHHNGSVLDEARKLVEKFGNDREYGDMLKIIEEHIAAQKTSAAPLSKKPAARQPRP